MFSPSIIITAQKVRDKYGKLKKAWKDAKKWKEQSGFGLREEDCEWSITVLSTTDKATLLLKPECFG